jgi:hypothetical protein
MADISKCTGKDCPKKESCYRFTAKVNEHRQSYFGEIPLKEDDTCDYYWNNEK